PPPPPNLFPPPPPPPPRGRSAFGCASLIFKARPPSSVPFNAATALSASAAFVISTNPNPRARPVSRSVTMLTFSTAPCASNTVRNSDSVVLWGKLPTYRFFIAFPLSITHSRPITRSRSMARLGLRRLQRRTRGCLRRWHRILQQQPITHTLCNVLSAYAVKSRFVAIHSGHIALLSFGQVDEALFLLRLLLGPLATVIATPEGFVTNTSWD